MSFTVTLKSSYVEGGETIPSSIQFSVENVNKLDIDVLETDADNKQVVLSVPLARIVAYFIVSDQAMVLKVNSPSAPVNTITLVAGQAIQWDTTKGAKLFTADITAFYLTKANPTEGGPAKVRIRFALDPTP